MKIIKKWVVLTNIMTELTLYDAVKANNSAKELTLYLSNPMESAVDA